MYLFNVCVLPISGRRWNTDEKATNGGYDLVGEPSDVIISSASKNGGAEIILSPRLLQETKCNVIMRDIFRGTYDMDMEVLGEVVSGVGVDGGLTWGVEVVSPLSRINVPKIKELLQRLGET